MSRLTVMAVEDVGTGAPLLPLYISCAWRGYMHLQDPQSELFDPEAARRKLLEAAAATSAAGGNRMSCTAGKAGGLVLRAALASPAKGSELDTLVLAGLGERPAVRQ